MKERVSFRGWYYFRQGWSMYFAFILAAINTLTVTYFLAIEKYPFLNEIFPTFIHYIVILASIGIPTLVLVGYAHYKRSSAYRSETGILFQANPYVRRNLINSELSLKINLELLKLLVNISKTDNIDENLKKEIIKTKDELLDYCEKRSFKDDSDLEMLKKLQES